MKKASVKVIAIAVAAATLVCAVPAAVFASANNAQSPAAGQPAAVVTTTADEAAYYNAEMQSDAIANVIDQAEVSGLFTQDEIDDKVSEIAELMNKECSSEEEKMERDDQISMILDEMEAHMDNTAK